MTHPTHDGSDRERHPRVRAPHGIFARCPSTTASRPTATSPGHASTIEAAPADGTAAYDENLHVMYHLIEGAWFGMHGDGDAHQRAVEAAVALADADGRPFPRAVARTLGAAQGPYSPGHDYFRHLAAPALDLDLRFGFGWLATVAECVHDWSEALAGHAGARTRRHARCHGSRTCCERAARDPSTMLVTARRRPRHTRRPRPRSADLPARPSGPRSLSRAVRRTSSTGSWPPCAERAPEVHNSDPTTLNDVRPPWWHDLYPPTTHGPNDSASRPGAC